MKTINYIFENSALGLMTNYYRYTIICLVVGIFIVAISLMVFMLNNIEYVNTQFNF